MSQMNPTANGASNPSHRFPQINLIGVSIAVFAYVDFEYNVDQVHENVDNIFLIQNVVERDGKEQLWGDSPAPIGAMLMQDYPQIKSVVRIDNRGLVFKYEDQVFREFDRFPEDQHCRNTRGTHGRDW